MADWSAGQYLKFESERTRPADDLIRRIPLDAPRRVVDIGCGPGNSTELLVRRFPDALVSGIDSSPAMLEAARRRLPGLRFELADAGTWRPQEPVDLLFSNAVFQWIPDHLEVLAGLFAALPPGGVLAIQIPDNMREPNHTAMPAVAMAMPFAARLDAAETVRDPIPPISAYYDRLAPLASHVDVWSTTYQHVMADAAAIVEWLKSTGLRPYLDPLDAGEQETFLAAYRARLEEAYPRRSDGRVLMPFPRLFVVAARR